MDSTLRRTPLDGVHDRLGARMAPFAGYRMPVSYPAGIRAEHARVREACGLFDVSHMGEFSLSGPEAERFAQYMTVNDVSRVAIGQAQYSALCRANGGVMDDLLIYRFADRISFVVNASNREKNWEWLNEHATDFDVTLSDDSDEIALIALQGPKAQEVLERCAEVDLNALGYYRFVEGRAGGTSCVISRTGYTGEDGFELYLPAARAPRAWEELMESGAPSGLLPAGLGARDSLRLEMGYALYGNDLSEEHTALEAGLGWIVKLKCGDFVGRDALLAQKEAGVQRRLTAIRLLDRGFPRAGYPVVSGEREVGRLTSGVASPSLGYGIAMAYLPAKDSVPGTPVGVCVRNKVLAAVTQRPPFYKGGSIRR